MAAKLLGRTRYPANNSLLSVDFSDPKAIAAAVEDIWANRSTYKFSLEAEWFQNIAWYMGLQNLVWFDRASRLEEPKAPSWRVRLVVNHLIGMVQTVGSKLYRAAPEWDVMPATTDAIDLQTAQVSNQLLASNWYRMGMDVKTMEVMLWMLVCGNGFIEHTWDPDGGPPIYVPGEQGSELLDDEDLTVGETKAEVVSPFEMIIDPRVDDFSKASWCMRSRAVDLVELQEDFPKAADLKPDGGASTSAAHRFVEHIKGLTVRGVRGEYASSTLLQAGNTITVHELWIKPRIRAKGPLKKGKHLVIAGGEVIKDVEFPYIHSELPFCHFREIRVPGRIWGTCTLEQLKPVQANYNKTKSQLVENRNMTSRPKWLIPKGSGISKNAFTSEPGELIDYNFGLKPEPLDTPQIPNYVQNMLVQDRMDMEDIAGIHEASRAEAPGQIRSGAGVMALVEQDEVRKGMVLRDFEFQVQRLGAQNLSVSSQYVTERRLAKIVGENDELLIFNYTGNDLIGVNSGLPGTNYFDVRVRTRAGLPLSRAAQQQLLDGLLERGILNPQNPSDRRLVLKLLSIGSVQDHLDKSRTHRSRQIQEIERLINGEDVRAEQWHEHETHLEVLNDFRNSARYDILTPDIRAKLEAHAESHKQWIAYNAVEPQIMTRKAAIMAMIKEQVGQAAQIGQNQGSNLLAGATNG